MNLISIFAILIIWIIIIIIIPRRFLEAKNIGSILLLELVKCLSILVSLILLLKSILLVNLFLDSITYQFGWKVFKHSTSFLIYFGFNFLGIATKIFYFIGNKLTNKKHGRGY